MTHTARKTRRLRCAIYTRKSSEEGLEQDFNSLHAQREACEAFIQSQKHEGWVIRKTAYDDGGISGGTLERPALQQLLTDITASQVDIVVVYKVDRLSRSLMDFAKLVEHFDAHRIFFVSVTQQFNTSTSMGRLTLNVLLSFAQFEREVTGERIRDKIAASKRKGLWMGGYPPLGYDVRDRQLVVNANEAETVRHIYRRYVELGSVRRLKAALDAEGVISKRRCSQSGRHSGGQPLARGALYRVLSNRLYRGEIVHKGTSYPGQQEAIVDQDLWEKVQHRLQANRVNRTLGVDARHPSLLAGLLFDEHGNRMTPTHAMKNGTRYRYYVSRPLTTGPRDTASAGQRLPAGEIEQLVVNRLRAALADEAMLLEVIQEQAVGIHDQQQLLQRASSISRDWGTRAAPNERALLCALIARIEVRQNRVDIHLLPARLVEVLRNEPQDLSPASTYLEEPPRILSVTAELQRSGMGQKLIIEGRDANGQKTRPDASLVKLLIKAHDLNRKLIRDGGATIASIARDEGLSGSYMTRLVRLAYLSPEITQAILDGRQPVDLTAAKLKRTHILPLDWDQQKVVLGFA